MTASVSIAVRCAAAFAAAATVLLGACSSRPLGPAPVESRTPTRTTGQAATPAPAPADAAKPAAEAPRPGYYTVKPGDTLIRIALDQGQHWRDIQRWNGLENPGRIEVGQQLRVVPPAGEAAAAGAASAAVAAAGATARAVPATGRVESRPLDARAPAAPGAVPGAPTAPGPGATPTASAGASAAAPGGAPTAAPATTAPAKAAREGDDDVNWLWPAAGPVVNGFDEAKSKGVAIGGKAGDPVLAAADGRVVYAGSGLRGYGNLIIVKHNATYLTAYAHNQLLLVKDEQVVRRGQKIAEMGSTDAERVQLHFEVRRLGVPVDPQKVLPPR